MYITALKAAKLSNHTQRKIFPLLICRLRSLCRTAKILFWGDILQDLDPLELFHGWKDFCLCNLTFLPLPSTVIPNAPWNAVFGVGFSGFWVAHIWETCAPWAKIFSPVIPSTSIATSIGLLWKFYVNMYPNANPMSTSRPPKKAEHTRENGWKKCLQLYFVTLIAEIQILIREALEGIPVYSTIDPDNLTQYEHLLMLPTTMPALLCNFQYPRWGLKWLIA